MLAFFLECIGCGQKLGFAYAVCRDKIRNARLAASYGACLIKRDDLRLSRFLERYRRFEQNAVFGAHSVADHYGNGRCKAERARAAYNEHRYASRQRKANRLACYEPCGNGYRRDRNDRRHKNARDLVGDLSDRRFRCGSIAHHADDLRKRRILADASRLAADKARAIHGSGRDLASGRFVNGDALAGERRFIDGTAAVYHHAVNRDALSGAHKEHVVLCDLLDRHGHFRTVSFDRCGFWRKLHQAFERIGGLAL